jgi:hypothetical protein
MGIRISKRPHKLDAQGHHLLRFFPSSHCVVKRGELQWRGVLRPTPLSEQYAVRISYRDRATPKTWVAHPNLRKRDGEWPPHLYEGERLCLYLPQSREWDSTKLIATTIVPWASEWLFYYELWHSCGKWLGGGVHPPAEKKSLKHSTHDSRRSHRQDGVSP